MVKQSDGEGAGRAIIVTGADANFHHLVSELVASLRRSADLTSVDLGCYDLGLSPAQCEELDRAGVRTVRPSTGLALAQAPPDPAKLGYLARPFLRENFPGYDVYIWLDADTWIQSGRAIEELRRTALAQGAALIREDEPTYRSNLGLFLWKGKHYLYGYGPLSAARLLFRRQINNGVFALRADAPLWEGWVRAYQGALDRTGLAAPHDQFGLNAAVHLGRARVGFLPAVFNWICDLSLPMWDDEARCFCSPDGARRRIEVVHLAGPAKSGEFTLRTTSGRSLRGRLRFGAALQETPERGGSEA